MYIEEIRLRNYKNFISEKGIFKPEVNVIIGENDSGKTNFMSAIRLVLDKKLPWYEKEIREEMFPVSLEDWRGHLIIVSLIFNDLDSKNEYEANFAYNTGMPSSRGSLTLFILPNRSKRNMLNNCGSAQELRKMLDEITINDYEYLFTAGLDIDYSINENYYNLVGDFKAGEYKLSADLDTSLMGSPINTNIDNIRSNLISFTYIDALRDSVREMNQKSNPLMTLIRQVEPNVLDTEKNNVKNKISELNDAIANVNEIKNLNGNINDMISESVGCTYSPNLSLKSDMSSEMKDVFRNLKLKSNIGLDLELNELGLGSNNIIYIALKLLENINNSNSKYFLLLFEEPEAHLHKHLQMTLFEKTGFYSKNNVQIMMSTHSDNISAASRVGNMNIIQKMNNYSIISNPSLGLDQSEIVALERYFDVKRSELLFSKSVILVEGDAEELLIPLIIKNVLGISLDEIGVSIINIGSVGFKNVYKVFNPLRIKKKCAILSDLDTPLDSTNVSQVNAYEIGKVRKEEVDKESLSNQYVKGFFGKYTFEVELVPHNVDYFNKLAAETYKSEETIETAKTELSDSNASIYGARALTIAKNNGKGWNALMLSNYLDGKFYIPNYIIEALLFVSKYTLKENSITILKHYCHIYNDTNLLDEIKNKHSIEELIDLAEHQEAQIIDIMRRIVR